MPGLNGSVLGGNQHGKEFYTEIKDGCKSTENFLSCLATLRHILGLWNRSMYGHQTKLNVIWN